MTFDLKSALAPPKRLQTQIRCSFFNRHTNGRRRWEIRFEVNKNQQRHRDDLGAGQPLTVKRLWMANTADEIQAILMEYAKSLLDENATLRARIAELEQPTPTEPYPTPPYTTVLGWLERLPDGYRERAIEQYDTEYEPAAKPASIGDAIAFFADWENTTEGLDFWGAVLDHYEQGTPLPPLPTER